MLARKEEGPRVSVVIPAYNAARAIEATLRSALGQSFQDLEVVVVDDGSADDTTDIVQCFATADPRVRLIEQANGGTGAARNRGVREARGEMIAFLDHDDLWHPDKLTLQVALLDARPEAAVASCYSAIIDERGRCTGWRIGGRADGDVYAEMVEWDMVSGGSVALVRREALTAAGPFDEEVPMRADWDMWIRLARRYPFATVPRALVGYRRTPDTMSRAYPQMVEAGRRVLANVVRNDPDFTGARHRFCSARDLFAVACLCAIDGEPKLAWRYVAQSLAESPQPILRRPRRWALLGVLALQTLLPVSAYRAMLRALNRVSFQLPPGQPFPGDGAHT